MDEPADATPDRAADHTPAAPAGGPPPPASTPPPPPTVQVSAVSQGNLPTREVQVRQWAMFLHLSALSGLIVPMAGIVVPIVLWQVQKTEFPELDVHGRMVVNWMISSIIYAVVSAILCLILIGIPMLMVLGVLCIVFPIIGGIKANNGEFWEYPMTIKFL